MLQAGFAHVDITPAISDKPRGSYRPRVMVGVHDPLLASACVIDDGKAPVALVGIDAGVIMHETFLAACALIEAQTPIRAACVVVSASHTHAGGPSLSVFQATADPEYAKLVARGIADAVAQAWNSRTPASCAAAANIVSGIHFNRRFHMRDGRQVTHPGKMNADIVAPAGPVDAKVKSLVFLRANGEPMGLVVNFGCHCTVTEEGNEYSADYVHHLREHLKRSLGPIEIVFLLGACGDVTQIDNRAPEWEKGQAHAEKMGASLALSVQNSVNRAAEQDDATLAVANKTVAIPIRERDVCGKPTLGLGAGDYWDPIYDKEAEHVARMRAENPNRECHVTAIRIGDLALVTSGAELFAQPALEIQQASPFKHTWTITLANEYIGYVPTASAHYAGGYEPRTARSSYLAPEAAQKLVETSLAAINSL